MKNSGWVAPLCFLALTVMAAQSAEMRDDSALPLAYPGIPPSMQAPRTRAAPPHVYSALMKDLQASDFAKREAAVARLVNIGPIALPSLQDLAGKVNVDVRWWVRAAIQQIEGAEAQRGSAARDAGEVHDLIAKGVSAEVLTTLRYLHPAAAGALIEKHLRLELGMDCVYSLRPSQALPRAVELLQAQTEPFYQMLLLRLIRNVLERALLPVPETLCPNDPRQGLVFINTNPEVVEAVRPFLKHSIPHLRREALLIMAWGQMKVPSKSMKDLVRDPSPAVAREARRLRSLLEAGAAASPDRDIAAWIEDCAAALTQDHDGLAQLGAYYALYELVADFPGDLARAATATLTEGRAKDAIVWILSQDAGGRAHLLRAGWERFPNSAPATLQKLLTLREYDLLRRNLQESRSCWPAPTLALVWRNLVNDDAGGYGAPSRGGTSSWTKPLREELAAFGQVNLGGDATSRMSRPENLPRVTEFEPWYNACAGNALSARLPIAVGAIRGLLVSDLAGARALVKRCGSLAVEGPEPATRPSLARDLIVMHPCVDLLDDSELSAALRALWRERRITDIPPGSSDHSKLAALPVNMPVALWGFMMQNDCKYMNPVGYYLADAVSLRHLPLLIAFLEYNSRAAIFLVELDACESVPAITREVLSRRKSYYLSYDHDLFHGVAHFGILDAAPVLEAYAKQNQNWPGLGVITLAGYETSRYCWTAAAEATAPNPLAAGILREIAGNLRAGRGSNPAANRRVGEFCEKGLVKMGLADAVVAGTNMVNCTR